MPADENRLVYSSEHGRTCPDCGRPSERCRCRAAARQNPAPPSDGVVRVQREKKGRKGKTVTTIAGVDLPAPQLRELAGELKRRCGSGGSLKDGIIEIQGDHVDALVAELDGRGFRTRRAGG